MSQPRPMVAHDWIAVFERLTDDVRREAGPLLGTEEGRTEVGIVGAGGDRTLEIDQRAEDVVLSGLREVAKRGERFSVMSEELGLVEFGGEYPRVVVDPIDGTPNARRGLRMVGVMLSLLTGPSVGDVVAGLTVDLTSGEMWSAVRGDGVTYNGYRLRPVRLADRQVEVLGLHGLPSDMELVWPLLREVGTFRQFYCMTLSLAYTASGGLDVFCSPRRARIFDLTAGLLMVSEVGGVVSDLVGRSIEDLPVDLQTRTTLLCSAHPDLHELALRLANDGVNGPRRS